VFRIDREKDSMLLTDPTYEFWQPSHNSCIKSFSFEPYEYGFSLPKVRLSEVAPMIDAVGTYRTAEFVGSSGDVSERVLVSAVRPPPSPSSKSCQALGVSQDSLVGRSMDQLKESDLVSFFNFFQAKTESKAGGGTVTFFKPSTSQYYGDVSLIVGVDANACVRSLSLTVRRSFIEEQSTAPFGRDVTKNFLVDVLSGSSEKGVAQLIDRIGGQVRSQPPANATVTPEVEAAIQVLTGAKATAEMTLFPEHLRVENITASNGAPLLRLSVW
jgi:hypothetical protein